MKLGFVSAILPELSLDQVLAVATGTGYDCVEVMCWPRGAAERRYAGVTHIDVAGLTADGAARSRHWYGAAASRSPRSAIIPTPWLRTRTSVPHVRRTSAP